MLWLCRTFCAWHQRPSSLYHGKSLRSSLILDNVSKCSLPLFLLLLLVFSWVYRFRFLSRHLRTFASASSSSPAILRSSMPRSRKLLVTDSSDNHSRSSLCSISRRVSLIVSSLCLSWPSRSWICALSTRLVCESISTMPVISSILLASFLMCFCVSTLITAKSITDFPLNVNPFIIFLAVSRCPYIWGRVGLCMVLGAVVELFLARTNSLCR